MTQGKCRTCKYGEVYNDSWCRCQHPVIKGCRVKISGGCEVEKLEKVREEYMKMQKESEYHADPYHADFAWDMKTVIDNFRKESE